MIRKIDRCICGCGAEFKVTYLKCDLCRNTPAWPYYKEHTLENAEKERYIYACSELCLNIIILKGTDARD